tara:strand:+ start:405 stop:638 length:234 start_codon:yes stop_codon:yes gene_type:complete
MTRNIKINRLKEFLESQNNLTDFMKGITQPLRDIAIREIGKEYRKMNEHPFPQEYQESTIINRFADGLKTAERVQSI